MIICPGCGAGMRFDIAEQKLKCDYCGASAEVGELSSGKEARHQENDDPETMDITLYTCPQCGGEIYSTGQEASSFCTFCGASVVLEGKLSSAKRPKYIIPFKKTKEDCKKIYGDLTKKAIFTPKELKDPGYLERFQGIYLPFWTYNFTQNGWVSLKGSRESGNYTEKLNLSCSLDASYDGISYDASSAFDDELCRCITPFNTSSVKEFDQGYMSGFYADTADVESSVYITDAEDDANSETFGRIRKQYPDVTISRPKDMSQAFHTQLEDIRAAMYPVWFLTYRSGDRVAYAVVNGETGKIAADLPVDRRRFLLGSLLLAIPLFLLLTLLPTITAKRLIVIAVILGVAAFLIYLLSSIEIRNREFRTKDKGYQAWLKEPGSGKKAGDKKEDAKVLSAGSRIAENRLLVLLRTGLPLISAAAGLLIRIASPVSDIYYYAGTIVIFVCICFTLLGLLGRFNLLTTRPIPQFHNREGGDDRAK